MLGALRRSIRRAISGNEAKDSNLPRTAAGAAERVRLNRSGEADTRVPATQMMKKGGAVKMKEKMKMVAKGGKKVPAFAADGVGKMKMGGMADMEGRALKRKTADAKGRAMKKTGVTGYGGVMGMKKGGAAKKKMAKKGK